MGQALQAGVGVEEFYRLTFGEIAAAINAHHERERHTLISRINAVVRGLSTIGGKKGTKPDPYKGLGVKKAMAMTHGMIRRGAEAWLFRDDGE